jgi:hypothetical protein
MPLRELTDGEKGKPYSNYYGRELTPIPAATLEALGNGLIEDPGEILTFHEKNVLLDPGYLKREIGYCKSTDGTGYVAMFTDMPGVSGEMIDWWYGWHSIESLRYMIWYPEAHFAIGVDDRVKAECEDVSYRDRYVGRTHYPVEDVGTGKTEELFITFVSPEEFGFDTKRFEAAGVATVVCTHVGDRRRGMRHTYMTHFVRKTATGVEMRSRFWIGAAVRFESFRKAAVLGTLFNTRLARKLLIKNELPANMAHHCAQEYANLAAILPGLYREYATGVENNGVRGGHQGVISIAGDGDVLSLTPKLP